MGPKRQETYGRRPSRTVMPSSSPPLTSPQPLTPPLAPATAAPAQPGGQFNAPPVFKQPPKDQAPGEKEKPVRYIPALVVPANLDIDKVYEPAHTAALQLFNEYGQKRENEKRVLAVRQTPGRRDIIYDNHVYIFFATEQRIGAVNANNFTRYTIDQVNEKRDALDEYARQNNILGKLQIYSAADDDQAIVKQVRNHIVDLASRLPGLLPTLQAAGVDMELPAREAVEEAKNALEDCRARAQGLRTQLEDLKTAMDEDEEQCKIQKAELQQKLDEAQVLHGTAMEQLNAKTQELAVLHDQMLGSHDEGSSHVADLQRELANVRDQLVRAESELGDIRKELADTEDQLAKCLHGNGSSSSNVDARMKRLEDYNKELRVQNFSLSSDLYAVKKKILTDENIQNLGYIDRVMQLVMDDGKVMVRKCASQHARTILILRVIQEATDLHWVEALEHDIKLLNDIALKARQIRNTWEETNKELKQCKQHGTDQQAQIDELGQELDDLKNKLARLYGVFDKVIAQAAGMAKSVLTQAHAWDQRMSHVPIDHNSGLIYRSVNELENLAREVRTADQMENEELTYGVRITMNAFSTLLNRAAEIHLAETNVVQQCREKCERLRTRCREEEVKLAAQTTECENKVQLLETQHANATASQHERHEAALALKDKDIEKLEGELKRTLTQARKDEKSCDQDKKRLEDQITKLEGEKTVLQEAKTAAEEAKNTCNTEKGQLNVELAQANQELVELRPYKGRTESLRQELDAEKIAHEQCKSRVGVLEGDLTKEKVDHQNAKDSIGVLQAKTATAGEHQQKISELERELQQARRNLEDERKAWSTTKDSLVKEKEAVERERNDCQKDRVSITEKATRLEGELSGLRREQSKSREELDQKTQDLDRKNEALNAERRQCEEDKNNLRGERQRFQTRAEQAEEKLELVNESLGTMTAAKDEAVKEFDACSESLRGWKIVVLDRLLGHPVEQWLAFSSGIGDFGQILTKQDEIEALNIVTVGKAESWLAVLSVPPVQTQGDQACMLNALQVWYAFVHPTEDRFGHQELYGLAEGLRNATPKTISFCLAILEHSVYQQPNKEISSSVWSPGLVTTWLRAIELLCTYYNGNVERLRPLAQRLANMSLIDSSKSALVRGLKDVEDARQYDCSWNFGEIDMIRNGQELLLVRDAATFNHPVSVVARDRYQFLDKIFHLELRINDYPTAGEIWVQEIDMMDNMSQAKILRHLTGVLPRGW
jgi:predicted  nucleic acid-binding Zn-ribbon protein